MTGSAPSARRRCCGSCSSGYTPGSARSRPRAGSSAKERSCCEPCFDFDRYDLRPQDKEALAKNADWLKAHAGALLLIEGHADERGTNEYNLALGERRAKAARDYLASLGIDGGRVTLISYGEERPLCTERAESCWARNRRGHFLVKP
jgi:peptidoglycan-associated lipoprotein